MATLALPIGVLLRPDASEESRWVLWWSLLVVGLVSGAVLARVRIRRGLQFQTYLQAAVDIALVTILAAKTGGRESQFALFYALVVIAGGLLNRIPGGILTAAASCGAFTASAVGGSSARRRLDHHVSGSALPPPGMLVAYLTLVGVLSGVLASGCGGRARTSSAPRVKLDRVRIDNDVILRHLTTGVLTVDGRGAVAYLNPAAEQVLGVRALDCRGVPLKNAFLERLMPLRDLIVDTLLQRAPRARAELMMHAVNGRALPVGISTNVLVHEEKLTGVVAVFQDLTEVREMERRARRNETLAEVGALSARIAHELRNGLNPISGSVECLQREFKRRRRERRPDGPDRARDWPAQPLRHRLAQLLARARARPRAARSRGAARRILRNGVTRPAVGIEAADPLRAAPCGRRDQGRPGADPAGVAQPREQRVGGDEGGR